jgi:hypothetical protein
VTDPFADLPEAPVAEEDVPKVKEKKPKQRSFFDCLTVIYKSKDLTQMENDISASNFGTMYSKYMVQRYLSFHQPYLNIIQDHQHELEMMTNEMHYRFLMKVIPQNKYLWIKYKAKKKKK